MSFARFIHERSIWVSVLFPRTYTECRKNLLNATRILRTGDQALNEYHTCGRTHKITFGQWIDENKIELVEV